MSILVQQIIISVMYAADKKRDHFYNYYFQLSILQNI